MASSSWRETSCSECRTTIKYHVDWSRIPDLCKDCIAKRREAKAKWHDTTCNDCRSTIHYHEDWDRIPDLCRNCIEARRRKKEENQAKWHTKKCAFGGETITYHEDWSNIPVYCKDCNQWQPKTCEAQGGYEVIRYKKYWTNISEYCKPCKSGERELVEQRPRDDGNIDMYRGRGYVNKNGLIVFIDNTSAGKHSHTVIRPDGQLVGEREEGHDRDWQSAEWKETECRQCGRTVHYHIDWKTIPSFCKDCWEIKKAEREESTRQQRKAKAWQVPIPYEEYRETVFQGEKKDDSVPQKAEKRIDVYSGINVSGLTSRDSGGIFEQDHTHTRMNDGRVTYDRNEKGEESRDSK